MKRKHALISILLSLSLLFIPATGLYISAEDGGTESPNVSSFIATDHGKSRTNVTGGFGTLYSDIPALSFRSTQTSTSGINDGITLSGLNELDWSGDNYDSLVMEIEFVNAGYAQGVILVFDVTDTTDNTTRKMYSVTNGMDFYRLPSYYGKDGGVESLIATATNFGWLYASAKGYEGAAVNNHTTTESFLGKFIIPFSSLTQKLATSQGSATAATGESAIDFTKDRITSISVATILNYNFQYMNFNVGNVSLAKLNATDGTKPVLSDTEYVWQPVDGGNKAAQPAAEGVSGNTYSRYGNDASVYIFLFTKPGIHFAKPDSPTSVYDTLDFQYAPEMIESDGYVDLNEYGGMIFDLDLSEYAKNKFVHFAFGLFNKTSGNSPATNQRWYSGAGTNYYIPDNAPAFYRTAANGLLADTKYGQPDGYTGKIYIPFSASNFTKNPNAGNFPKGSGEKAANVIRFWLQCSQNYGGTIYFRGVSFVKDLNEYLVDSGSVTSIDSMREKSIAKDSVLLTGNGDTTAVATLKVNSYYADYSKYGSYFILEKTSALAFRIKNPGNKEVKLKITVWESSSEKIDLCDDAKTSDWIFYHSSGLSEKLNVSGGFATIPAGYDGVLIADYDIKTGITTGTGHDGVVNGGIWNLVFTMNMSENESSALIIGEAACVQSSDFLDDIYVPLLLEGNNDSTSAGSVYSWTGERLTAKAFSRNAAKYAVYKGVQETAAADEKFNVRFIATLDALHYTETGLIITISDSSGTKTKKIPVDTVYGSLIGSDETGIVVYTAAELNGKYLMAVTVTSLPANDTVVFTVTPYTIAETTFYGETYNTVYIDGVYQ